MNINKKPALGKGLSALISNKSDTPNSEESSNSGYIPNLPINLVVPNPFQPRIEIDPQTLLDLADSIRNHGIIEPLIVNKKSDLKYELIAGERRWRAAQIAGLETVPVVIKDATPQNMLELAIIENVQRQDLNPFEEALAFEQLYTSFNLTHEEISKKVSLSRPTIVNKIRLLTLPENVKKGLLENKISEGHARALLGLVNFESIIPTYEIIVRDSLSVRAVEELVRRLNNGIVRQPKITNKIVDEKTTSMENNLQGKFGQKTTLSRSKKGGSITIRFNNDVELEKIYKLLIK